MEADEDIRNQFQSCLNFFIRMQDPKKWNKTFEVCNSWDTSILRHVLRAGTLMVLYYKFHSFGIQLNNVGSGNFDPDVPPFGLDLVPAGITITEMPMLFFAGSLALQTQYFGAPHQLRLDLITLLDHQIEIIEHQLHAIIDHDGGIVEEHDKHQQWVNEALNKGDSALLPPLTSMQNVLPKLKKLRIQHYNPSYDSEKEFLIRHVHRKCFASKGSLAGFLLPFANRISHLDLALHPRYAMTVNAFLRRSRGSLKEIIFEPLRAKHGHSIPLSSDVIRPLFATLHSHIQQTSPSAHSVPNQTGLTWGIRKIDVAHVRVNDTIALLKIIIRIQEEYANFPGIDQLRLITHEPMPPLVLQLLAKLRGLRTIFLYSIDEPCLLRISKQEIAEGLVPEASLTTLKHLCIGSGDSVTADLVCKVLERGSRGILKRFRFHESVSESILSNGEIRERWPDYCIWSGEFGRTHGCRCPIERWNNRVIGEKWIHEENCPCLHLVSKCWERNRCLSKTSVEGYFGNEVDV